MWRLVELVKIINSTSQKLVYLLYVVKDLDEFRRTRL